MTAATSRKPTKKAVDSPKAPATEEEQHEAAKQAGDTETGKSRRKKSASSTATPDSSAADAPAREAPEKARIKRAKKDKVVRDSFTMPRTDYQRMALLKRKCLEAGVAVRKSEILRAGLQLLESAPQNQLLAAIAALETVKTGRPAKDDQGA